VGYVRAMFRMTATEAARHFPALLGRVAAGEEVQIVRDGATVAVIGPPPGTPRASTEPLIRGASFAEDIAALQAELEAPPEAWAA
jgi:antitoxin (DNA-binding transcriptional repressor) of toxin-antitoxin stability system